MPVKQAEFQNPQIMNGVEVEKIMSVVHEIKADAGKAKWKFRSENKWMGGTVNCSVFKNFSALGTEKVDHKTPFEMKADEPLTLSGNDLSPNPVEHLLHALTSCLTTSMVAHAAVRGIEIKDIRTFTEGDLDVRGFLGMSKEVPKGYQAIRVRMDVKSKASVDELKELALFSPVYDVVSRSVLVDLIIEKSA